MGQLTTIAIKKETRSELKKFGEKGDTYDEILKRMIAELKYELFMEDHYRRLGEKDKFTSLEKA